MNVSLQSRLLVSLLLVITITGVSAAIIGVAIIDREVVKQAQDKVRLDLNAAHELYLEEQRRICDAVRFTAGRFFIAEALSDGKIAGLTAELGNIRTRESLDILTVTDAKGRVLWRTRNPSAAGDDVTGIQVVRRALSEKEVCAATEIVPREALLKESKELAGRAVVKIILTRKARPTKKKRETSAMALLAAAPIFGRTGEFLGVLYGGKILNRNHTIVDKVKETVYQGEVYEGKDMGTATIFQGDIRIATNVLTENGERAIGTCVSSEVHDRVLREGRPWVERAFVVKDWYITAYRPIRDLSGDIVGMLYVGMLEKKFSDMRRDSLLMYLGVIVGGVGVSLVVCVFLTRKISRPVDALLQASEELARGNLGHQVRPDESIKEIALLGHAYNVMASSIKERDEQLRRRAEEELRESERLATIGRLAAGIAHEINNPLGGILLISKILLRGTKRGGAERENLERITRNAERCQKIVRGLLDFARQREPKARPMKVNDVVEQSLSLLENQHSFQDIEIVKRLDGDLPFVSADASQIQQVFVNILVNAVDAMKGKGTLTITSKRSGDGNHVEVEFADTGVGIPKEDIERIFDPFFTTKEVGKGTGLGLSISHGIIKRHGGSIKVHSDGRGTVIAVSLPVAEE